MYSTLAILSAVNWLRCQWKVKPGALVLFFTECQFAFNTSCLNNQTTSESETTPVYSCQPQKIIYVRLLPNNVFSNPALNFFAIEVPKWQIKLCTMSKQVNLPDPSTKEPAKIIWTVCFAKYFFPSLRWVTTCNGAEMSFFIQKPVH